MKHLKLVLRSLISNNACIEGGRHSPWWIAIIMFFVSMALAVTPILVQTSTKTGSSFANNATYTVDIGLRRFAETANDKGLKMIIKENDKIGHYLDLDQEKTWNVTFETVDHSGFHKYQHLDRDNKSDFDVFYIPDLKDEDIKKIVEKNKPVEEEGKETQYVNRTTSFIVFTKTEYVLYQYNGNSSSVTGSAVGDYKPLKDGDNILDVENVKIGDITYNHVTIKEKPEYQAQYESGVWTNWKTFFDKGYEYTRGQLTWKTTLLMFGINAAITIFMGLMIFILTRGKSNPYRIYTFIECQLIAFWATITPAVLSLALGFLLAQFAQIMYPLLLGVRVMWLSMKSLRPEYTTAPQQNQKYVKTVDTKPAKKDKKSK